MTIVKIKPQKNAINCAASAYCAFWVSAFAQRCCRILALAVLCALAMATQVSAQTNNSENTLLFGIVPQQSAKKLARTWGPVIRHVNEETGLNIKFATATDIPTFEQRLADGKYDIAYMNPYHYAIFSQRSGYQVIAKQKDKFIQGIIVVPVSSNINTLEDLQGSKIAFPAPLAFAATLIPTAEFNKRKIAIQRTFVNSHDSVYMNVSRGFFAAGGGVKRTLSAAPDMVKNKIKVLWQSPKYTPHAIAVSPTLSKESAELVQQALVGITQEALLKPIAFKGFEPAKDDQWDSIRALDFNVNN